MKFVDQASIRVVAGKGGDGCLSFRREKCIPRGGPNGGNGGNGGSVFLQVDTGLNTLVDFRHARLYRAGNGQPGMGSERVGKAGKDIYIRVPLGTLVYDEDSGEILCDLNAAGECVVIARGGQHGLGNSIFKSSTCRAPRKTTAGKSGEEKNLRLELRVLADVGLLGLPNAGKSTLIRAVSAARPKVADYPFTTLYPQLGVVRIALDCSFVLADIPGIIQGAAEGAGLGLHFLQHLERTRLLLHLVDVGICTDNAVAQIHQSLTLVATELDKYSSRLANKKRWLVLTKSDLLPTLDYAELSMQLSQDYPQLEQIFVISALTGEGCDTLMQQIAKALHCHEDIEEPVS